MPLKPFDPGVNMNGWSCSTASSSQRVARRSWNVRWRSLRGAAEPVVNRLESITAVRASPFITSVLRIACHPWVGCYYSW